MRKTATYLALAAGLAVFLSCQREPLQPVTRTPIELSAGIVGGASPQTKAVTLANFSANTNLYMVLFGEKQGAANKFSRTMGTVTAGEAGVSFGSAYTRFWEDCYSRDSKLSVFAACVPGKNTELSIGNSSTYNSNTWSSTEVATTIAWPLSGTSADQTAEGFLDNQDLCFSNNISGENCITFNTTTHKFNSGNLVFQHALTWITFKIKRGNGFANAPFAFSNAATQNIVLSGFNSSGQLTISEGSFPSISTAEISKLAIADHRSEASPAFDYILDGYLVPGTQLTGTDINAVSFVIDNNSYHISKDQLRAALAAKKLSDNTTPALTTENKMRPGVHYVFEFTVSKKSIDKITATLVPWETVTVDEYTPTNARIQVSLLHNGTLQKGEASFDLYRSTNTSTTISDVYESYDWTTGYAPEETPAANKAWLTENETNSGIYTAHEANLNDQSGHTPWYWPNNKTFYHFRTVMPKETTVTEDGTNGDYISLSFAPVTAAKDVCWGAPFKNTTGKLTYSTSTGFDNTNGSNHQISKAIGPTKDYIDLQMFHMLSEVTINLSTTTGDDQVDLTNAKMELSNIYKAGLVRMGNGLVVTTNSATTADNIVDEFKTHPWHAYFVPQPLATVKLTITTADHNQYEVDMADVVASAVSNNLIANPYTETAQNSGKYTINSWYPNYQYTYSFKLSKSGIADITATLADWETVSAGDDEVKIR